MDIFSAAYSHEGKSKDMNLWIVVLNGGCQQSLGLSSAVNSMLEKKADALAMQA